MKKNFIFISLVMILSTAAFASGKYHGDIQFHNGAYLVEENTVGSDKLNGTEAKLTRTLNAQEFDIDIETWHLFDINCVLSAGLSKSSSETAKFDSVTVKSHTGYIGLSINW